jgi:hypothetical protein
MRKEISRRARKVFSSAPKLVFSRLARQFQCTRLVEAARRGLQQALGHSFPFIVFSSRGESAESVFFTYGIHPEKFITSYPCFMDMIMLYGLPVRCIAAAARRTSGSAA